MLVGVGLALGLVFSLAIAAILTVVPIVGEIILAPMWILGTLVDRDVSAEQVVFASGFFYGFAVAFLLIRARP